MVSAQMVQENLPEDYACDIPVPFWSDPEVKVALDAAAKKTQVRTYYLYYPSLYCFWALVNWLYDMPN